MDRKVLQETEQDSREIQYLLEGYHQRDQRLASHFFYIVQVFAFFTALLGTANLLIPNPTLRSIAILLLFVIVFMAIVSLIADIQANISCKNALRKEMERLGSRYWVIINGRKKGRLERLMKPHHASLGTLYISTSYLILIAWIVVCLAAFFISN
jgi:hypothetical protein